MLRNGDPDPARSSRRPYNSVCCGGVSRDVPAPLYNLYTPPTAERRAVRREMKRRKTTAQIQTKPAVLPRFTLKTRQNVCLRLFRQKSRGKYDTYGLPRRPSNRRLCVHTCRNCLRKTITLKKIVRPSPTDTFWRQFRFQRVLVNTLKRKLP